MRRHDTMPNSLRCAKTYQEILQSRDCNTLKNRSRISMQKTSKLKSRGPGPDSLTWKIWQFPIDKIKSQELLTDPDCTPESAKSVSNSRTGSHARDGVVTLRENPSTISSLVYCLSEYPDSPRIR